MPGFVEANGPGVVGPLAAGWSASFSAMPHSPLYESGTTGQISFSAPSAPDTAFLMFNRAVFQYFAPDFWDELGVPTMLPINDTTDPSDGGGPNDGGNPNDGSGNPDDPNGWGNVPWGSSPWGGGTAPGNPNILVGWGAGTWGGGTWGGGAAPPTSGATVGFTGSGGLLLTTSAIDGGTETAATQVGFTGTGGLTALAGRPAASVRVPLAATGTLGTNQSQRASATVKLSGGSGLSATGSATITPTGSIPAWDHVVVVIMENKASTSVISNGGYMTDLANANAYMTNSFAVTHPSLPNYLALWSGSTQGVTDDGHYDYAATVNHLGAQMTAKGITFKAYSEDLPSVGYLGDTSANYARKHAPWVSWQQNGGFSGAQHVPFTQFPTDFTALPKLSFVIPNLIDDVHDAGISTGNTWLQAHIDPYVQWAKTHNSLLILTFDEDDGSSSNHIYTAFAGARVKTGQFTDTINHYSVLGLLQDWLGLPRIGASVGRAQITSPWSAGTSFSYLNATSYGATGNGSTDDQTALTNAISAAKSAGLPLYLPPGTYNHSGQITLNGVVLFGETTATSILNGTNAAGYAVNLTGTSPGLYNVTVQATGKSPRTSDRSQNGIYVNLATGYTIRNVHVKNVSGAGVMVENSSNGLERNNLVELTGADGIYHTESSHHLEVAYNQTITTGDDAISFTTYGTKWVHDLNIHHNSVLGNFESRAITVNGSSVNVSIHDNHIDGGTAGISLVTHGGWSGSSTQTTGVEAFGNTVRNINRSLQNTGTIGGGALAFWNDNAGTDTNLNLHDNQIYNPGLYGIYVGGTGPIIATVANSTFYMGGTLFRSDDTNATITRTNLTTAAVSAYPGDLVPSTVGGLDPTYHYTGA